MQRRLTRSIPYIYIFLTLFNIPLENIGILNAHYYFFAIAMFWLKLQFPRRLKLYDVSLIAFLYFMLLASLVTLIRTDIPLLVTLKSFVVYIASPIFWFYYFSVNADFDLNKFKRYVILLGCVTAILGIIQFFGSKTIYGMIPKLDYYEIDFSRKELVSVGSHFRVRSILPSPQIYGLFISLTFCLFTSNFRIRKWYSIVLAITLLLGSLLSGQRIVILVYVVYFGLIILSKLKRSIISLIFLVLLFLAAVYILKFITDTIFGSYGMSESNLFDFNNILAKEYEVRWNKWIALIRDTNFFIGNGIGRTELRDILGRRLVASESYLVQLYYEGGIFVLGAFLSIIGKSILFYKRLNTKSDWILLITLFVSLIIVHSFLNPIFYAYWAIIVYPFTDSFHNQISTHENSVMS